MAEMKYVKNAIVFADSKPYDFRWFDAHGDVKKYIPCAGEPTDDTTGEPTGWTNTETGTNTWVNSVTAGEDFTITTGGTEYNGYSSQLKGECFKVASGKPFYVGAQLKLDNATEADLLFGLAETDTTLTAASSAHAIGVGGDGLFFAKIDGVTAIKCYNYLDGAETANATCGTMDTSYHKYEIYSENGDNVKFYFDGTLISTVSTSLADGDMTLSLSVRAGSGAARTLSVKNMRAIQVYS